MCPHTHSDQCLRYSEHQNTSVSAPVGFLSPWICSAASFHSGSINALFTLLQSYYGIKCKFCTHFLPFRNTLKKSSGVD